jgi:hypothetical protein
MTFVLVVIVMQFKKDLEVRQAAEAKRVASATSKRSRFHVHASRVFHV